LYLYRAHRPLHSFPTRRSSDLGPYPHPPRLESIDLPPHDPPHLPLLRNGISALTSINASLMDNIWQVPQTVETLIATVTESAVRSEEHTSELQSRENLVCRLLL